MLFRSRPVTNSPRLAWGSEAAVTRPWTRGRMACCWLGARPLAHSHFASRSACAAIRCTGGEQGPQLAATGRWRPDATSAAVRRPTGAGSREPGEGNEHGGARGRTGSTGSTGSMASMGSMVSEGGKMGLARPRGQAVSRFSKRAARPCRCCGSLCRRPAAARGLSAAALCASQAMRLALQWHPSNAEHSAVQPCSVLLQIS